MVVYGILISDMNPICIYYRAIDIFAFVSVNAIEKY